MAPFSTAIKNGILFAIFSIIGAYVAGWLLAYAFAFLLSEFDSNGYGSIHPTAITLFAATFVALALLVGIPFFKFLSDTVEEGMIEF